MSYGHLATMFPVGSPGLPTPPASQITGSPSPPSSTSTNKTLPGTPNINTSSAPGGPQTQPQGGPPPPQQPAQHCCENGRPMMADPHTGQTVCSCQYGSALLSSYSRLPLTSNIFGTSGSYGTAGSQPPYMPLGTEGSAFYSPLGANGSNIRDSGDAWRSLTQPSIYDTPAMGFYPYGPSYGGLDLNARRKNATRESTNTLKAWLQEHIKNPYPTKGEKIMLAIITKMTLTQVSTWFANARRRLKKENKMTWSPRNRSEDGDDEDDDENDCDNDRKNDGRKESGSKDDQNIDVGTESNEACAAGRSQSKDANNKHGGSDVSNCRLSPELPHGPAYIANDHSPLDLDPGKPKIWSVTDFLGSGQAPGKDGLIGDYPKLDFMKAPGSHDYNPSLGHAAMFGRSAASNALSSLSSPAHQLHAYQSTLGYSAGAYPYSTPSYGGGKLLRPSVSTPVVGGGTSRFSPFPPSRPIGMDSSYPPRREMGISREGE